MNPHGGVPLQDNPRFSTETQRVNGYRQSTLPDRADRLLEDIRNGNYNCGICFESVNSGNGGESLWSCSECHNIWHYRCAQTWANEGPRISMLVASWKCPGCSVHQSGIGEAHCWCGKRKQSLLVANDTPNSCGSTCDKIKTCPHERNTVCSRFCHPGPCNQSCSTACPIGPVQVREPNAWKKACARLKSRKSGSVTEVVIFLVLLLIIEGLLTVFIVLHMHWWTMPYLYPGWLTKWKTKMVLADALGGSLITLLIAAFMCRLLPALRYLLELFFDVPLSPGHNHRENISWTRQISLLDLVFVLIFAVAIVYPVFGLAGLPEIAWYNQMKNSCEGHSTRILFEAAYPRNTISKSKFEFESLSSDVPTKDFYSGTHLEPMFGETKEFQFSHRLSGQLQNGTFIAVDVDTEKNVWRVKQLSHDDQENQWESHDNYGARPENATTLFRPLPTFTYREERLVMNGTIGTFSKAQKHIFIPDLAFVIQNMYDYIHSCEIDEFMRVFNTQVIQDKGWDLDTVLGETWNGKGKNDERNAAIELRTASFGHGSQDITFCGREHDESSAQSSAFDGGRSGKEVGVKKGMKEDLLVPFAILASFRDRAIKNSLRSSRDNCGQESK